MEKQVYIFQIANLYFLMGAFILKLHGKKFLQDRRLDNMFQNIKKLWHRFEKVSFYLLGLPNYRCTAKTQLNSL